MKFTMNDREWKIIEAPAEWLLKEYQKEYEGGIFCFGLTRYSEQVIYLNEELCKDVKKQTLYHELMHCYMWNYMHNFSEVSEEAMCDISANSHEMIHKIVKDYFKIDNLTKNE